MAWFNNRYVCPDCQTFWESDWSSPCEDECGQCGLECITPVETTDITLLTEKIEDGYWRVLWSPPEADDHPCYQQLSTIRLKEGKIHSYERKDFSQ